MQMSKINISVTMLFLCIITPSLLFAEEGSSLYPGYPQLFDVRGKIDRLAEDKIVINDSMYDLAPDCSFNLPGNKTGRASFEVGTKVGLLIEGKQNVRSVWFIEKKKSAKEQKKNVKLTKRRNFKQHNKLIYDKKNKVWRNIQHE